MSGLNGIHYRLRSTGGGVAPPTGYQVTVEEATKLCACAVAVPLKHTSNMADVTAAGEDKLSKK